MILNVPKIRFIPLNDNVCGDNGGEMMHDDTYPIPVVRKGRDTEKSYFPLKD